MTQLVQLEQWQDGLQEGGAGRASDTGGGLLFSSGTDRMLSRPLRISSQYRLSTPMAQRARHSGPPPPRTCFGRAPPVLSRARWGRLNPSPFMGGLPTDVPDGDPAFLFGEHLGNPHSATSLTSPSGPLMTTDLAVALLTSNRTFAMLPTGLAASTPRIPRKSGTMRD